MTLRKEIPCKNCGTTFKPHKSTNVYCGNECYKAHRQKQVPAVTIKCKNDSCTEQIKTTRRKDGTLKKEFCSRSCAATYNIRKYPKRQVEGTCIKCSAPTPATKHLCQQHEKELVAAHFNKTRTANCQECQSSFTTRSYTKKYCSKQCANKAYKRDAKTDTTQSTLCPSCYQPKSPKSNFCQLCSRIKVKEQRIAAWLDGEWTGGQAGGMLAPLIRTHLIEQANYKCSKCGFGTNHPVDGKSILEINHIDGDGSNHRPDNLEVLCPNCHALTPNYRARNWGNGRKQYYLRVNVNK